MSGSEERVVRASRPGQGAGEATAGPGGAAARPPAATRGPVLIIGTGLLGTSLALVLRAADVPVQLQDTSPTSLALARDMGAGAVRSEGDPEPALVVVATPPDVAAQVVVGALEDHPGAVVTDVASVKARVGAEVRARAGAAASRYVGSHPMAGRERSGASAADSDLFAGRPWVIVADGAEPAAEIAVRNLAMDAGAAPVRLGAAEHDDAVAAVSHMPQLISSLVAARLEALPEAALELAGQGIRDVTRIAASDPRLWSAIVVGNAGPVAGLLRDLRDDLDALIRGIEPAAVDAAGEEYTAPGRAEAIAPGAVSAITDVMSRGNAGRARIPGKHGGAPRRYAEVQVLVPDEPGYLGRLFTDVGEAGVNIEDFAMEHSAGQSAGLAMISVLPSAAQPLEAALDERGWRVVVA